MNDHSTFGVLRQCQDTGDHSWNGSLLRLSSIPVAANPKSRPHNQGCSDPQVNDTHFTPLFAKCFSPLYLFLLNPDNGWFVAPLLLPRFDSCASCWPAAFASQQMLWMWIRTSSTRWDELGSCQLEIHEFPTMWGPQTIAKLVQITPITMVYCTCNYSIHGVYKPTNITGGPHIVYGCHRNGVSMIPADHYRILFLYTSLSSG